MRKLLSAAILSMMFCMVMAIPAFADSGGMPQKVSHINPAFQSFMWDGVSVFPTGMAKTGGLRGILLF